MSTVLVIGGGGAGLAAACEAGQAGADVLVVDAAAQVGGATAMSGGVILAAGTETQKRAGITDDDENFFTYYMSVTDWLLEPRLVRRACSSHDTIRWLEDLGLEFPTERLYRAGIEHSPRGHIATGPPSPLGPAGGAMIVSTLLATAVEAGVQVRTGVRIERLLTGAGRVVGAASADEDFMADAVVVASGGFGGSPEMIARYWPDAAVHGDKHWYIGPETNVGDGLRMAVDSGAAVAGHNRGAMTESPGFGRILDPFTPPWIVYVNRDGHRFINEMASYVVLPQAIRAQRGGTCFGIYDEAALSEAIDQPAFADPYGLGAGFENSWNSKTLREQHAAGQIHSAGSIAELAELAGIHPAALTATVAQYNVDAADGHDTIFEKPAQMMLPISTPPFYAVEVRSAVVGMTFTGLRIDDHARVLDAAGLPIPGLFAAGEVTGGVMGPMYPGGGASVGNALTFGRVAGRGAASVS